MGLLFFPPKTEGKRRLFMTSDIGIATAGHNKEVCRLEVDLRSENGSNTNLLFTNAHRLCLQQKDLACNAEKEQSFKCGKGHLEEFGSLCYV